MFDRIQAIADAHGLLIRAETIRLNLFHLSTLKTEKRVVEALRRLDHRSEPNYGSTKEQRFNGWNHNDKHNN